MTILTYFLRLFTGYFLQVFPYAHICILPFENTVRVRRPRVTTLLFVTGSALIFSLSGTIVNYYIKYANIVFNISNAIFMFMLGACFVYYCIVVKASFAKKAFVFSFAAIIDFFVTLLSNMVWTFLLMPVLKITASSGMLYHPLYLILLFLPTAAVFCVILRLLKRHTLFPELMDETDFKYIAYVSVILLIFLSLSFALRGEDSPTAMVLYLALCVTITGLYIIIFMFIKRTKESQEIHIQLLKSEHINDIAQAQYNHICENIEAQRHMRHDFRQQLITLRGLCGSNEGRVREYLSEYLKQIPEYSFLPICSNPILSSIISYYKSTAEADGFCFECNISIPVELNISDADIVTILGNILENALDAGRNIPKDERSIIVNIGFSNKMLGVAIDNTFDGNVSIKEGKYISTKHEHTALGLQSIKSIADKYNGDAVFNHKGNVFCSSVMLANIISNK